MDDRLQRPVAVTVRKLCAYVILDRKLSTQIEDQGDGTGTATCSQTMHASFESIVPVHGSKVRDRGQSSKLGRRAVGLATGRTYKNKRNQRRSQKKLGVRVYVCVYGTHLRSDSPANKAE